MVMRGAAGVGHGGQLIPVGVQPLLGRFLVSHEGPLAVGLGGEVVEMAEVAALFLAEFGEGGAGDLEMFGKFCGEFV